MRLIDNHNWNPKETCCEEYCNNSLTHYEIVEINGLRVLICLCEKHITRFSFFFGCGRFSTTDGRVV